MNCCMCLKTEGSPKGIEVLSFGMRLFLKLAGAQKQAVARVNTEALKFVAQGVGAVVEVDRILPYTQPNDARLQPLLKVWQLFGLR